MINAAWRTVIAAVLLLIATTVQLPLPDQAKKHKTEIEICDFKMPHEIARANATFLILYGLQIGADGRPTKVEKIKMENTFPIPDEPFVSCIKGWVLPVANHRVSVLFQWKHGAGWTQIELSGTDLDYVIKVQPGAFDYGSSAD